MGPWSWLPLWPRTPRRRANRQFYRQELVDHLSSGTSPRASQVYERGTSFNLAEPLLRLAELEVRTRVRTLLLLLVVPSSNLRSQVQVWIDRGADCQFDARDAGQRCLGQHSSRTINCEQSTPQDRILRGNIGETTRTICII